MSDDSNSDDHDGTYSHHGSDLDRASWRLPTFMDYVFDEDDVSDGDYVDHEEKDLEVDEEDYDDEYTFSQSEEEVIEYADPDGFWGSTFLIHEGLLRANSDFFDRASRAPWKEGVSGIIHLPAFENEIFQVYNT